MAAMIINETLGSLLGLWNRINDLLLVIISLVSRTLHQK